MNLEKALTLYLGGIEKPVITAYDFGLIVFQFYKRKKYKNENINISKDVPGRSDINRYLDRLVDNGILSPIRGIASEAAFSILGKSDIGVAEIICSIDPFAYISHLSAMEYHGLTERIPKIVFLSTFPSPLWREKAKEKMIKDYGEILESDISMQDFPRLTNIKIEKINGISINSYRSKSIGSFVSVENRRLRVSSIGRTFLDMLREPQLCGGLRHVIDVYVENAGSFKKLIIDEIDRNGTLIDKSRAGYVLEEHCKIYTPVIDEWSKNVLRGGSRKLDPHEPFSSEFSEKWCISLNY